MRFLRSPIKLLLHYALLVDFLSTKSANLPLFKESLAAFLPFLDSVDYLSLMLKEAAVFQIHYHDRIIVRNHLFFIHHPIYLKIKSSDDRIIGLYDP